MPQFLSHKMGVLSGSQRCCEGRRVTHTSPHLGPENQDVLGAASHGAPGTGWLEGGGWVAVGRDLKERPLLRTRRQTT